jgi:hypothetical protein
VKLHLVASRDGLSDWAGGVGCVNAVIISDEHPKITYFTYMTVVTTSKVLAGAVATSVGGATHLVQIVEVYVLYTVDVVAPVCTLWLPPTVIVSVTGQVVT